MLGAEGVLGVDCGDGGEDAGGDGIGGVGEGLGELEQLETTIAIAIVRASDRTFLRLIIMTPAPVDSRRLFWSRSPSRAILSQTSRYRARAINSLTQALFVQRTAVSIDLY